MLSEANRRSRNILKLMIFMIMSFQGAKIRGSFSVTSAAFVVEILRLHFVSLRMTH